MLASFYLLFLIALFAGVGHAQEQSQSNPSGWKANNESGIPSSSSEESAFDASGPTDKEKEIVTVSDRAADAIGLQVVTVKMRSLPLEIAAPGQIEAMPTRSFIQHALIGGRVTDVKVELGQQVKAGQILAILDSPEINKLAAETLNVKNNIDADIQKTRADFDSEKSQAIARLDLAKASFDRFNTLVSERIAATKSMEQARTDLKVAESRLANVKQKEKVELNALEMKRKINLRALCDRLEQLGATKKDIEKMINEEHAILSVPVTATRPGVITSIEANPGETINGTDPLFDILDYSTVWAEAQVYESDMDRARANQRVIVKANALPDQRFEGRVSHVGSQVDPKTRTLPVRVEIPNPQLRLKPDMFVELYIQTDDPAQAVILPRDSVVERAGHYGVFVEVSKGFYQLRVVETGRSLGDNIEVVNGIKSGERVVTRGAFQLEANLLKNQGKVDLFTHPTEAGGHDHEKANDPHDASKENSPLSNPMMIVIIAGAFVMGTMVATLVIRLPKKQAKTTDSTTQSEIATGEEKERSRRL